MQSKKEIGGYIFQGAVLLLAVILLVVTSLKSTQSTAPAPLKASFEGEYSLDGGEFRQLSRSSVFMGRTLVLRGKMIVGDSGIVAKGEVFRFFLDHICAEIKVGGETVWSASSDVPSVNKFDELCGKTWCSWESCEISPSEPVEITLYNFHGFGNGCAFRSFLDNIYVCEGADFELYMLRLSLPARLAGFSVIAIALVLIGLAFGFRRSENAKRLFHWGAFAIFSGAYLIFDTINFSINFSRLAFGTVGRFMTVMTAGLLFSFCVADALGGKVKKIGTYIAYAQAAAAAVLFVITTLGFVGIFNAQYVWIPVQTCASLALAVCIFADYSADRTKKFELLYLPLLTSWIAALANAIFGLFTSGMVVKPVFVLTFAAFLVVELRKIVLDREKAERAHELEEELKSSRIVLATGQIRSHFIFNVLNAISGMCKYDPKLADETIVRFARYLRSNVDILGNDSLVSFSKELCHVEDYIGLEQVRYGSKIEFTAETETEDFPVPTLILQPIVENAVKHGILPKKEGGIIRVRTFSDDENNIITVTDDGVGFDAAAPRKESSVGLTNVEFRLKTMVGGTISTVSESGKGTTVTVKIPKEV